MTSFEYTNVNIKRHYTCWALLQTPAYIEYCGKKSTVIVHWSILQPWLLVFYSGINFY